jgi:hypothetical protein
VNLRRKRIEALTTVWSIIVSKPVLKREEVVEILKSVYESMNVEPIRGASSPPDLYEKELSSLYIIGRWGLGIDKDLQEDVLKNVFSLEIQFEQMWNSLKKASSQEEFCKELREICSKISEGIMARFLRFIFTLYYFGFIKFEELISSLRKLYSFFNNLQDTIKRFTKFVIAYEIGLRIESGKIKAPLELNMEKNLLALNIGIPKTVPSTSYIIEVSKHFFTLPNNVIKSLLKAGSKKGGEANV